MKMTYDITPTDRPRWFHFRRRVSATLVQVAKFVYPESPEVKAFVMKQITDAMIYGGSIVRVDPCTTNVRHLGKDAE